MSRYTEETIIPGKLLSVLYRHTIIWLRPLQFLTHMLTFHHSPVPYTLAHLLLTLAHSNTHLCFPTCKPLVTNLFIHLLTHLLTFAHLLAHPCSPTYSLLLSHLLSHYP